jgi:pimeloyl-ACP methyl ester carboxylesterase
MKRSGAVALALTASVVALLAVTVTASSAPAAKHKKRKPGSTGFYKVNGHRLYLTCKGKGRPTIVLDSGLGDYSDAWSYMKRKLGGPKRRVCAYDRYRLARSAGGHGRVKMRTIDQAASDLHVLIRKAKLKRPVILVGASIAGLIDRDLARLHPKDVAGLVMLDTAPDDWDVFTGTETFYSGHEKLNVAAAAAALRARDWVGAKPVIAMEAGNDESVWSGWALNHSQEEFNSYWDGAQRALAEISSNSIFVFATGSAHDIANTKPKLAIQAVKMVERAVRKHAHLPLCANSSALLKKGGDCNGTQPPPRSYSVSR